MGANDLYTPLRGRKPRARRSPLPALAAGLVAVAVLLGVTALVWTAIVDDSGSHHPGAVATIREGAPGTTGSLPDAPQASAERSRAASQATDDAVAAPVEAFVPPRPLQTVAASVDPLPDLVEESRFGLLPRVSEDGLRPLDAYARAPRVGPDDPSPRVVIVVGGLGLSQTGTQRAIHILPEDVTFAFAPYGSSLRRWVQEARQEGHEVLLQVPLEPFGYPQTDPGPQTLLASSDAAANEESLMWSLGRITAYTGVMNYMGGRFLAEDAALEPFLADLARRGLFFLDDGSSQASRAGPLGASLSAPVVTGDLVLDRVRTRDAIEAELAKLEEIARRRGLAVGVASAFGTSVDAIAAWLPLAEERGIVVVPASAALARGR